MPDHRPPPLGPAVAEAFAAFPEPVRPGLMALRGLIFEVAATTPSVGRVEETLKWGQPAYLTPETNAGSTLRLGLPKSGGFALFVHCRTTLIEDFQRLFPGEFRTEGSRAVLFEPGETLPRAQIAMLVAAALTYRLR